MTPHQFKRVADAAMDLTHDQAHKLFHEIIGWLHAGVEDRRESMGELRDFVAGEVTQMTNARR